MNNDSTTMVSFFRDNRSDVRAMVKSRLWDADDGLIDDMCQTIYHRMLKYGVLDAWDASRGALLSSYIYAVAGNAVGTWARREKVRAAGDSTYCSTMPSPNSACISDAAMDADAKVARFDSFIRGCPEPQRTSALTVLGRKMRDLPVYRCPSADRWRYDDVLEKFLLADRSNV